MMLPRRQSFFERFGFHPAAVRAYSGGWNEDSSTHANSRFHLRYIGLLAAGGNVKVDITTIREQLVFPFEARPVLRAYEESTNWPDRRVVQAYAEGDCGREGGWPFRTAPEMNRAISMTSGTSSPMGA